METLIEEICIIKGSSTQGSVNLDSLTNFSQVIMPPKLKAPEFIKYDGIGDPCPHLCLFCGKKAPNKDNHPLLYQIFLDSLIGPAITWYVRLERTSSWREMANAFLEYYQFNTEIAFGHIVL